MKHLASFLMIIPLVWFSSSCLEKPDPNTHHYVFFVNESNQDLFVGYVMSSAVLVPAHSADSVNRIVPKLDVPYTCYEDYQEGGWIIIRVFDDVRYPVYPEKDRYAFEKQHTILTWRLDYDDILRLNWRLTYPPTEEMKDLKVSLSNEIPW